MTDSKKDNALAEIALADLEKPIGGSIEDYCEQYSVTEKERPVFERFLHAKSVRNRSAALAALVECGKMTGYESSALQLHYDSRDGLGSPEEFAAISYLREMRDLGSTLAWQMLDELDSDPYVRRLYGD